MPTLNYGRMAIKLRQIAPLRVFMCPYSVQCSCSQVDYEYTQPTLHGTIIRTYQTA